MTNQPSGVKLPTSETDECAICGQSKSRHVVILGTGLVCPFNACVYRPKPQPTSPALPTDAWFLQTAERAAVACRAESFPSTATYETRIESVLRDAFAMQAKAPATSLGGVGLREALERVSLLVQRKAHFHDPDARSEIEKVIAEALAQPTVAVEGLVERCIVAVAEEMLLIACEDDPSATMTPLEELDEADRQKIERVINSVLKAAALSQPSSPAEHGPQCSSYMTACQDCLSKFMRWKEAGEPSSPVSSNALPTCVYCGAVNLAEGRCLMCGSKQPSSNEDAEWLVSHGKYLKSLIGAGKRTLFFDSDIERLNRIANTLEAKPVDGVTEGVVERAAKAMTDERVRLLKMRMGIDEIPGWEEYTEEGRQDAMAEARAAIESLSLSLKGEG